MRKSIPLILLFVFWIVSILLVNPFANFPLNDDWAFSESVSHLVNEGQIKFSDWQSMTLIAQVFWGALFCIPFGFSFIALRVSTLFLGLLGVFSVYLLMQEIGANRRIAFFAALLIAANPFYFVLSNSFMTDIPFFAFFVLSLLFFIKGMRNDRYFMISLGVLFSLTAVFIRHIAIVIPLSFAVAYVAKKECRVRAVAVASFVVFFEVGSLALYQWWLTASQRLPRLYNLKTDALLNLFNTPLHKTMIQLCYNIVIAAVYIGFFISPFLFLIPMREVKNKIIKMKIFYFALIFFLVGALISIRRIMPITTNILYDFGLGPVLTHDVFFLGHKNMPAAPQFIWFFITAIGILCGAFLLYFALSPLLKQSFWKNIINLLSSNWEILFFSFMFFLYFFPLGATWFFDRYLIPLFFLAMAIVFLKYKTLFLKTNFVVWVLLFFIAIFAVGATHDYFSWNSARWDALDYLTNEMGLSPNKIDGGLEFNAIHNFDFDFDHVLKAQDKTKSWWWVHDDKYMITFGPVEGFKKFKEYGYNRWMPYGTGKVYILKRTS